MNICSYSYCVLATCSEEEEEEEGKSKVGRRERGEEGRSKVGRRERGEEGKSKEGEREEREGKEGVQKLVSEREERAVLTLSSTGPLSNTIYGMLCSADQRSWSTRRSLLRAGGRWE